MLGLHSLNLSYTAVYAKHTTAHILSNLTLTSIATINCSLLYHRVRVKPKLD